MTVNPQENLVEVVEAQKANDKEYNFSQMRKQLEQERSARQQAEERAVAAERLAQQAKTKEAEEDDNYDEPYVDNKRLEKKFSSFEKKMDEKIERRAEEKARALVENERQQNWMKSNPDFYDVMQHAQKFAEKEQELAETILQMPEGFERQKLVYKNIKALGLHKAPEPQPSIQEKIDANRRSPYYQPSSVGTAPYAAAGDYSPTGQKTAYQKMQELKSRIGV